VRSTEAPGEGDVVDFLRRLRGFRGTLTWVDKALLDSLVAAGLGRTSHPPSDDRLEPIWAAYAAGPFPRGACLDDACGAQPAGWQATPWGRAYSVRYW
jgi:hypothetical protein